MKTGLSSRRASEPDARQLPDRAGKLQYCTYTGVTDEVHHTQSAPGEKIVVKRVFVQSFGCRASQADGASIEALLQGNGFAAVNDLAEADLVVVNTCTVTSGADIDARRVIRSLHRDNPEAKILVTGCYAQRAPNELSQIEGVRWVVGNANKTNIADIVSGSDERRSREDYHGEILVGDISAQKEFATGPAGDVRHDRTRPNLKVQDGCSNRCAFCIIPSVRGRSRSASLESVVEAMQGLSNRYCEIVLSGINLGRWGRDLPGGLRFVDLLRAILERTQVQRLRISSVEPMDWSDDLLELVASDPRIARHVHIPLQSGCDAVLKRMFRKYRTRHYANRLDAITRLMPDAAIGADVMTGFPGETETEFQETVQFVQRQPFTYLHVFTYSERPGTMAANAGCAIPVDVRRERTRILRETADQKSLAFRRRMVGKTVPAVTLEQRGAALTTNFLKVKMADIREPNRLVDLPIDGLTPDGLKERSAFPVLS